MEITSKKITKNIISLTSGQILSILLNFIAIAIAARSLGPQQFGLFSNVLAIIAIISKFADIGFAPIVFRELSKNENDFSLLNSALSIRIVLFLITLVGLNIFYVFSAESRIEIIIANILMLTIVVSAKMANFRELLSTPFKVHLKMHYPMILLGIDNLFLLIGIYLLIISKITIVTFTIIYALSNLPGFIFQLFFLYKKFGYKFKLIFSDWKWLIEQSIPIGGFVVLMAIFQQVDLIILNYLNSSYDAGIYSIALRLSMPLNIIPTSIVITVFPIIVKKMSDRNDISEINKFVFKVLFFISFAISIIFYFKASEYIVLAFGDSYFESFLSSNILLISQIFLFFNFFALDLLTAHDKQRNNFLYATILVISNITLAIFFIPAYNHNGAAVAKLITTFAGFIFLSFIMKKNNIEFNFINIRVIFWSLISILILYGISFWGLFIYTILAPIVILAITILIGFFNKTEINFIKKIIGIKVS
ncbi:MAG: hypothetical protein CMF23_10655 [Ignavibacteriae bacterium]|nr:hypothetical protein [Ignavibacteriota bacterium]